MFPAPRDLAIRAEIKFNILHQFWQMYVLGEENAI